MSKVIENNKYRFYILTLLSFLFLLPTVAHAQDNKEDDLDMKTLVFDHMGDAYEWHIITLSEDLSISLPLPIIVYSSDKGWNVFMSSKLRDGKTYKGFKIGDKDSAYEEFNGKLIENIDGTWAKPTLDLSMTKVAAGLLFNSLLVVLMILFVARWYRRRDYKKVSPGGFTGFMEMFIMMVHDDIIKDSVGENYKRFAPYLLTVFFFVFLNNIISLVPIFPGGVGVTGNIAITAVLALCTMIATNLFASKHYWKEVFWPDVPLLLKVPVPLFPLIEFVGILTKPFALMIRLFANMLAGHMAIIIFVCLIFISAKMGPLMQGGLSIVSVLFTLFMNFLELLVSFIQAYVFTLLSAVFIGLAQEGKNSKDPYGEDII